MKSQENGKNVFWRLLVFEGNEIDGYENSR